MNYTDLYEEFKQEIPAGEVFYQAKERENKIDETDGVHIVFGLVVVPYIFDCIDNQKEVEAREIFSFLERMAICEETKISEVLDFTVLERIVDEGQEMLNKCKAYMGEETLKHCDAVEKYFLLG